MTAEVGDDVFGDDPTVKKLEAHVADLFGKEASLYVPSGTMANQICLKTNSQPGWELLCERDCHVVNYEVAGPAAHSSLLVNLLSTDRGMITAEQVRANIRPINIHAPETKLVALENTHNRKGGTILPQDEVLRIREVCDEFGLIMHLDGARIWNAHVVTGLSLEELAAPFDSVACCLSKGLGAPIGSMILGSEEFVTRCRRERKLFGGGMRQVGIIAAAGLYAVENNIGRLVEDHANARLIAEKLDGLGPFRVDIDRTETNIILADISGPETAATIIEKLAGVGVLAVMFGPQRIRLVTHLDVSQVDCREALDRIEKLFG